MTERELENQRKGSLSTPAVPLYPTFVLSKFSYKHLTDHVGILKNRARFKRLNPNSAYEFFAEHGSLPYILRDSRRMTHHAEHNLLVGRNAAIESSFCGDLGLRRVLYSKAWEYVLIDLFN
jgi:hypothetical protein